MSAQALMFEERPQPALGRSFALAALMHLALIAVMFLGVRWQSHRPDSVVVELWEAPPPRVVEAPKPPPPPPKVEPAKPEPPPARKPDIAVKEKPKPKPKPEAKPKPDPEFEKRIREQAALEQKTLEKEQQRREAERKERELRELLARQQADARSKALAAWTDKIRAKIRSNILLPGDLTGNPEAIFDVALLPTGEVLSVQRRKSSGHRGYDEAVERAILKSSPLPKPDQPSLFERRLELRFRPQDK